MYKFDDVFDVVFNINFVYELERSLSGFVDLEDVFVVNYVPLLEDKKFDFIFIKFKNDKIEYVCGNFDNFDDFDEELQNLINNRQQIISNKLIYCFKNYAKIPIFVLLKKLVRHRQNYRVFQELLGGYYDWAGATILSFSKFKFDIGDSVGILTPINPIYYVVRFNYIPMNLQFHENIYNLTYDTNRRLSIKILSI